MVQEKKQGLGAALSICFLSCFLVTFSKVDGGVGRSGETTGFTEQLIDVGDCRLNFRWIRGRDIVVLLEAGGGMDSGEWDTIGPAVARRSGASVVVYDRAGFGKSDLPDLPCEMGREAAWLFLGLKKLSLERRLVLVGHSYGGWMIKLMAHMYPESVAGMVFVDPFSSEFVGLLGVDYLDRHPMTGNSGMDLSHPEKMTKIERAVVRMVGKGLGPKMAETRDTVVPKGVPVTLITSALTFLPKAHEQEAWRKSHEMMLSKIAGGKMVVAQKSGHMIPVTQPELVVDAIVEMVQNLEGKREDPR